MEQGLGQVQRFEQVQVWVVGQLEVEVWQQQNFVIHMTCISLYAQVDMLLTLFRAGILQCVSSFFCKNDASPPSLTKSPAFFRSCCGEYKTVSSQKKWDIIHK